ncbi:hypothetical protein EC988_004120, partial [Linderina pennispora]
MAGARRSGRRPASTAVYDSGSDDTDIPKAKRGRGRPPKPKIQADDAEMEVAENSNGRQISAQEEADLSSALIAKLLAEDGGGQYMGYYDDYGNTGAYGDFDEGVTGSEADDDWDPNSKKRKTPKGAKKTKPVLDSPMSSSESDDEARRPASKRQRKPAAKKPAEPVAPGQYRSGGYTDEEEAKFCEGLELFGRDWSKISEHVVTRDPKSIRSHAQKYLIKLFRDKVPLPAKVLESGEGYTLSGRPLDPNSAAARPYLQRVMELDPVVPKPPKTPKTAKRPENDETKETKETKEPAVNGGEQVATSASKESTAVDAPAQATAIAVVEAEGSTEQLAPDAVEAKGETRPVSCPATPPAASAAPELPKSPVRTEYALNRPQRQNHTRTTTSLHYHDPHQMVRCTPFPGAPLSSTPGCQPFKLIVHSNAKLQMDFHAHLMMSEVIGLLGGQWNSHDKVLTVVRAFPCKAIESEDAHTNVEMDPGEQLAVTQQINGNGLRVVGWYHSHPTFRPDPSIIDIENQTAYQALFKDDGGEDEPFVGAIVGPYDPEMPGPVSAFNWFY